MTQEIKDRIRINAAAEHKANADLFIRETLETLVALEPILDADMLQAAIESWCGENNISSAPPAEFVWWACINTNSVKGALVLSNPVIELLERQKAEHDPEAHFVLDLLIGGVQDVVSYLKKDEATKLQ